MIPLGSFGKKKKKTIVIFEISNLEFVQMENLLKRQKCLNLGPKMPYLGVFGSEFLKKILSYLKLAISNLFNCKILWKNENA